MRRSLISPVLLVLVLLLALPSVAQAKDLRKKLGIGFNNNFSSMTSVSVKLGLPMPKPTQNLQVQVLAGFSLIRGAKEDGFVGGRLLVPFIAGDVGLFRGQAVLGVEFFFFGLERLGFSAEFGLNLDLGADQLELTTTSGTAASVGVHYYFGK
jgi:hypothetical protein